MRQDADRASPRRPDPAGQTGILPNQRSLFDIPEGLTYLNCAFMSPQLNSVTEAGRDAVARKARPWEIGPPDFFDDVERLRRGFASLINADTDGVAIVPSVSYGMATAAAQLNPPSGSEILVLEGQFPSHVYPWRTLADRTHATVETVKQPDDLDWTSVLLDAIDERTSLIAVPACHWTDGSIIDLASVASAARQVGAALIVDGTQAIGAVPIDLSQIQPDLLVTAGYKWLMGPYSLGLLWAHPHRREGRPIEEAWSGRAGSRDFARLVDYRDEYRRGARRYDVGETANFSLVPMAIAAIEQLQKWAVDRISAACRSLTEAIADQGAELGFRVPPEEFRSPHLIGLRLPRMLDPGNLAKRLQNESIYVSIRGDAIRVSPHVYNDGEDISALGRVLEDAATGSGPPT